MDDQSIIELFWNRSEDAISEANGKYGRFCYRIAYNILSNPEDAEESVSDALLSAWNAIPPRRPKLLAPFLGRITRNLAIDRLRTRNRDKRGGGEAALAKLDEPEQKAKSLEELEEVVGSSQSPESEALKKELADSINRFLDQLPRTERRVFLLRYWYVEPIADIAEKTGFSPSKVTSMLHRIRGNLKKQLIKEELL